MLYQWYHLWKWNIVFVVKLNTPIVINLFIHSKSRTSWLRLQKSSKGKSPFREINAFIHEINAFFIRESFAFICKSIYSRIFRVILQNIRIISRKWGIYRESYAFYFARVLFYRESRVIISKSFAFIRDKLMFLPSKS